MCPKGTCSTQKAHARGGFLAGSVAHERSMLGQSIPEGLHSMENTHARLVPKELQLVGSTWKFVKDCICEKDPTQDQRNIVRRRVADTKRYKLTTTTIPLHQLRGRIRELRNEAEPGKNGKN